MKIAFSRNSVACMVPLSITSILLIFFTVAEQTCELVIWKIPQNVWVENLRNMLYQLFRQSCFSAPA